MDDHPIVLQQGVESLTVSKLRDQAEVVGVECPRQSCVLWGLPEHQEGVEAKLEVPEPQPEQHRAQSRQDAGVYGHDWRLEFAGVSAEEHDGENEDPAHPHQKAPFLSAPEAAQHVAERHGVIQVLPDVLKFIPVRENQQVDECARAKDSRRLDAESPAAHRMPWPLALPDCAGVTDG